MTQPNRAPILANMPMTADPGWFYVAPWGPRNVLATMGRVAVEKDIVASIDNDVTYRQALELANRGSLLDIQYVQFGQLNKVIPMLPSDVRGRPLGRDSLTAEDLLGEWYWVKDFHEKGEPAQPIVWSPRYGKMGVLADGVPIKALITKTIDRMPLAV